MEAQLNDNEGIFIVNSFQEGGFIESGTEVVINWWSIENELLTHLVLKKMNFYVSFLQKLKKKNIRLNRIG